MKKNYYAVIVLTAIFVLLGCGFSEESGHYPEPAPTVNIPGKITAEPLYCQDFILFHSVRPGDNLYGIAHTYGTTVVSLKKANNLEGALIRAGQQLYVPLLQESAAGNAIASANASPQADSDIHNAPLRFQLVKKGVGMLGVRYQLGGSEESGFDCSGLVKNLFSRFDIEMPRSSRQQYLQGTNVNRDKLETGDLVFFSSGDKQPNHVGIYIGGNKFLHAALKAKKVIISDLNNKWYAERFLGGRRIMPLWSDAPGSWTEEIKTL